MNRRLLLLNGLAIIAVVISHVAGWGQGVMTSDKWQGIFASMRLSGYDGFPGTAYVITTILRMLTAFAVPSFFFVTGFFIAYAERGSDTRFSYRVVFARIGRLIVPYTFWSILVFTIGHFVLKQQFTALEYVWIFISFGATFHLYYVPALILFYLLIPPLIAHIRRHPRATIIVVVILQALVLTFNWMTNEGIVSIQLPEPFSVQPWFSTWWISKWILFGTLGIVCGFSPVIFSKFLDQNKNRNLAAVVLVFLFLAAAELAARLTNLPQFELAARLIELTYGVFFIFIFLTLHVEKLAFARTLNWLSSRIFGIYLLHFIALDYLAHGLGLFFPAVLGYQILFQPLLVAAGLGIPLLCMQVVINTPLKKYYRLLFG